MTKLQVVAQIRLGGREEVKVRWGGNTLIGLHRKSTRVRAFGC